ncbi:unnamed protein product [Agarophyton chilense]
MFSQLWQNILEWLQNLFFQQEMELTILGLQNAGKTTLVNLISTGDFTDDRIPTVGFNMRRVQKGGVTLKMWDLGGQSRFRTMWERYCRGVSAVVYVVDAADNDRFDTARLELHDILSRTALDGIPVLFLANKSDLPGAVKDIDEIINIFGLKEIENHEISVYSISAKNRVNIDVTLQWLIDHGSKKTSSSTAAAVVTPAHQTTGPAASSSNPPSAPTS